MAAGCAGQRTSGIDYGRFDEGRHVNYWNLERVSHPALAQIGSAASSGRS